MSDAAATARPVRSGQGSGQGSGKASGLGLAAARRRRRLWVLALCALGLGAAAALALTAFRDNLVFFRSPSDVASLAAPDIAALAAPGGRAFRLGGMVERGSVVRDGLEVRFTVTDGAHAIPVTYHGVLPDLFREGQGVVTMGRMRPGGGFAASEVLARHDESYMPPEVKDALQRSGHWNPAEGAPPPASGWNTLQPAQLQPARMQPAQLQPAQTQPAQSGLRGGG